MFVDVAHQIRRRLCMQVVRGSTLFFFNFFYPLAGFILFLLPLYSFARCCVKRTFIFAITGWWFLFSGNRRVVCLTHSLPILLTHWMGVRKKEERTKQLLCILQFISSRSIIWRYNTAGQANDIDIINYQEKKIVRVAGLRKGGGKEFGRKVGRVWRRNKKGPLPFSLPPPPLKSLHFQCGPYC